MNAPINEYIDQSRAVKLLEKWKDVLDYSENGVKQIENPNLRLNTAVVLENQEKWCFKEANDAGSGGVFGSGSSMYPSNYQMTKGINNTSDDTYATGDARLPKILIPMIRRTFPELITNEIVGVQPMSGPVGLAFAMRYKYAGVNVDGTSSTYGSASAVSQGSGNTLAGELGYQYLDTRFTGTSSTDLSAVSGADGDRINRWLDGTGFNPEDAGIAAAISTFERSGAIPTIEVSFEKTAVEAGTRRLGARWSIELEQDLKNMNGIDVDAELTNAMSYEIQAEIDREMVIRMVQTALKAGKGAGYSLFEVSAADGRWLGERNRAFYQRIIVEANNMAVRNRRGAANFIVATPRVCSILEALDEFQWMPVNSSVNTTPTGVAKLGTIGNRFTVYRDTRTESSYNIGTAETSKVEYALLGYKGAEYYDTGIIYCPYIPVMVQRSIDPSGFYPKVGLLTRYGVVDNLFGSSLYYHLLFVKGLGQSFIPASSVNYF